MSDLSAPGRPASGAAVHPLTGDHAPGAGPISGVGLFHDWRVLVPRAVDQAGTLLDLLWAAGAEPVAVPLIAIAPPEDPGLLDLQLVDLAGGVFSWVGFTSANAVSAVLQRSAALGLSPPVPANTKVAAVGPATAAALRAAGLPVDLVPPGAGSGSALADIWPTAGAGEAVLLPRSDIARPGLPQALVAKGFRVEAVTAYRTVVQPLPPDLATGLIAGKFAAVLLTSPSIVSALSGLAIPDGTVLGAIGEPTAHAARVAGLTVTFTATSPTADSLVAGLKLAATTRAGP